MKQDRCHMHPNRNLKLELHFLQKAVKFIKDVILKMLHIHLQIVRNVPPFLRQSVKGNENLRQLRS